MKKILATVIIMATLLATKQSIAQTDSTADNLGPFNFTLEQCIEYAFGNSYSRKSIQLSGESADASYQQSKKSRLPNVSASASESMSHSGTQDKVNFSGNIGVSASVPIYDGGNIKQTIEQNRLQTEKAKVQLTQADDNLTIQILQQFLTALSAQERLKYQEAILATSREQMNRGEVQFRYGKIIESDYLMLQAQYASDIADSLNTAITLENSLISLKKLMSMNAAADLSIIYPSDDAIAQMALLPEQFDAVNMAKEHMPDMILAKTNMEIAETSIELAKTNKRPTVNASAGISTGHSDFDNLGEQFKNRFSQNIGISVGYTIFDRGNRNLQLTKSKIQQQQAQLDLQQTELDVTQNVITQYRNVELEYQRFQAYEKRKDAYAKSFEAYQKKYEVGSIMAVELLQQQNNYISVLNSYINSKYGFILNRKILDVYTGQITE